MDEDIKITMIIVMAIIIIVGISFFGSYSHKKMRYENFQETIKELSDEQKCMHICGFQYPYTSYFDQYKFCLEK